MNSRPTPPPPHPAGGIQPGPLPVDTGDAGSQHRDQGRGVAGPFLEKPADPGLLVLLDVDQEHVGAVLANLEGERAQQVRLHRLDADDEEAPQPDREQDDAGLVAGPRQVEDGVTHREPGARAEGLNQPHQNPPDAVERHRDRREPAAHPQAGLPRGRLPARQRHQPHRQRADHRPLHPVARRGGDQIPPDQGQRLDGPHLQQRPQREQQRDEDAHSQPLDHGRAGHAVGEILEPRDGRRPSGERGRQRRQHAGRQRHAPEERAPQPQDRDLNDVDGQHLAARRPPGT